jgi:nucleoside-diphosphate-sugar epimerase
LSRVVVTGGSGKLGRAVVDELLEHRYEVINIDSAPPREAKCPFTRVDLTDHGQTLEALMAVDDRYSGVDAVVHLAAIPAPGIVSNVATFTNNMMCSYNVFSAARVAGIKNLVWASSETTLGLPFTTPPPYIPVDEEYAARPETTYAHPSTPIPVSDLGISGDTSTLGTGPRRCVSPWNTTSPAPRSSSSPMPTRL